MADFTIKEDGVIVRNNTIVPERDVSAEQDLYAEYNRLVYEVIGHPDRFTPVELEIKKQIGYLPSEVHLYDDLTVKLTKVYGEGEPGTDGLQVPQARVPGAGDRRMADNGR